MKNTENIIKWITVFAIIVMVIGGKSAEISADMELVSNRELVEGFIEGTNLKIEENKRLEEEERKRIELERLRILEEEQRRIEESKRYVRFEVSYYCSCYSCTCSGEGITASGEHVQQGVTIACPEDIPFYSTVYIENVGTFINQDTGGYIKWTTDPDGNEVMRVDVYLDSHEEALRRGRHYEDGYIILNE